MSDRTNMQTKEKEITKKIPLSQIQHTGVDLQAEIETFSPSV